MTSVHTIAARSEGPFHPQQLPFYYGWVIVAVAFVTMGIGVSARTAFSLLFPPVLEEFGWDRGQQLGSGRPALPPASIPVRESQSGRFGQPVG